MPTKVTLFTPLEDGSPTKMLLDRLNYEGQLHVQPCAERSSDAIRAALAGARALFCRPNDGIEFAASDLVLADRPFVVGTFSSGVTHLDGLAGMPGISIVRSADGNAGGVAEVTINLALGSLRRTFGAARAMELGLYEAPQGRRLEGKHWLVIGAGQQVAHLIAMAIGLRLNRFTIYHDRMTPEILLRCLRLVPGSLVRSRSSLNYDLECCQGGTTGVSGTSDLTSAIPEADIISLHVPPVPAIGGRPGTEGMVDRVFLALTKQPCHLINVARGRLFQEEAVVEWLNKNPNNGLGVDVLDERAERSRDPSLSPLHQAYMRNATIADPRRKLNITVLSHIAGSALEDFDRVCIEVTENVLTTLKVAFPVATRRFQ